MFMSSTLKDFDKLADEVVSSFLNDSVPISAGIVKVAARDELNPEEIKRLVEKSNTNAAIKLIKVSTEGSVEFDLADYSKILKETHSDSVDTPEESVTSETSTEKIAMINTMDKEDVFSIVFPKKAVEKVASDPLTMNKVFKGKLRGEILGRKKVALELKFKKCADTLLGEFNNLYAPDFQKFACEAYTLFGNTALPILEALASDVREPKEFSKVAYIIDDVSNKQLNLFKEAHTTLTDICSIIVEIADSKTEVKEAWSEIRRGCGAN